MLHLQYAVSPAICGPPPCPRRIINLNLGPSKRLGTLRLFSLKRRGKKRKAIDLSLSPFGRNLKVLVCGQPWHLFSHLLIAILFDQCPLKYDSLSRESCVD